MVAPHPRGLKPTGRTPGVPPGRARRFVKDPERADVPAAVRMQAAVTAMNRRDLILGAATAAAGAALLTPLAGCEDARSDGDPDASLVAEAGSNEPDATAPVDTGAATRDSSTPDSGSTTSDGPALADATGPGPDTGGTADAGDPGADAAAATDAGAASCPSGAAHTAITSNHGHSLMVPAADVRAGTDKTYSIRGSSLHDHNRTLTAAHFAALASGVPVTAASFGGGHTHDVTLECA